MGNVQNLEISGNLTAVREMSRNLLKVGEVLGEKSCQGKLFIVNFTFGATAMFSSTAESVLTLSNICTTWILGNRNVGKNGKHQKISQCLEASHNLNRNNHVNVCDTPNESELSESAFTTA